MYIKRKGLIANILGSFSQKSNLNMIHFVGESSSEHLSYYESLLASDKSTFVNQNSERSMWRNARVVWEVRNCSNYV